LPFGVVKLHFEFNQRAQSTPHKFKARLPSQKTILFQTEYYKKRMNEKCI